jgi:hypothetical protein
MTARLAPLLATMLTSLALEEMAARGLHFFRTWRSHVGRDPGPAQTVTHEPVGFTRMPRTCWPMPLHKTVTSNTLGFRDAESVLKIPSAVTERPFTRPAA